jgi:hypothetical protein
MLYRRKRRSGNVGNSLHYKKNGHLIPLFMKTIFYCLSKSINSMLIIKNH